VALRSLRILAGALAAALVAAVALAKDAAAPDLEGVPRYQHVFVIFEENKDYAQMLDPAIAPNIAGLAAKYGNASQFFAEVHPSEANYVALVGGDTFGIFDDDGYFCRAGSTEAMCMGAAAPGYPDHTVHARHLGDQLIAAGLTWRGYYESLPEPGSLVATATDPSFDDGTRKTALYASKHSGFMNFADVQSDPARAERIVGFDQLRKDLASGVWPSFALIVPNQCNDMHGMHAAGVPADCDGANPRALIGRGDAYVAMLVRAIQGTQVWRSAGNVAIVITFDEGAGKTREGCCGVTPDAPSNFGGGHIPTIVITNHGPRGLTDDTPYNHYSLLRTLEDAFGVSEHLGRAADSDDGVKPMTPLFSRRR
jgi:hypothetical protein